MEVRVRTTASLETIRQLIEGRHENPFELLGSPRGRPVGAAGVGGAGVFAHVRPGVGRRPGARQPDAAHAADPSGRPVRGDLPVAQRNGNGGSPRYMLRVAEEGGKKTITMHDPYSFPHLLTDYDRHLLNEGRHWQCYNRLGAQLRKDRRRRRREFRRLGPQRHQRERGRRFQPLGRPPASHAEAHPQRLLGVVRAGAGRRNALQVPDPP